MHRLSTSFVLGYHGCTSEVAERLLAGKPFKKSDNEYDWLGPGVYFWQSNPLRAQQWATALIKPGGDAAVVGAVIDPRICLDLATAAGIDQVRTAYQALRSAAHAASGELPTNHGGRDLLKRNLDCAVVRMLHDIREQSGEPPIDTISGIFIEGDPLYENAGFREKTHVQICVCNPDCIVGVFRVNAS